MDFFGIGAAVTGAAKFYFQSARATGRSTIFFDSLRDGDCVVFATAVMATAADHELQRRGRSVRTVVMNPCSPNMHVLAGFRAQGRLLFDHVWVEKHYLHAIAMAGTFIDELQERYSRHGVDDLNVPYKPFAMRDWGPF